MNSSLLVIGHGSRSQDAVTVFEKIVDLMRSKSDYSHVKGAHMELAEPGVAPVVEDLVALGVKDIVVVPYFLYEGMHYKNDIPEILEELSERFPAINFKLAKPIGYEPLLVDVLLQRAAEV